MLGAPKCGATSIVQWLKQHPNVFISPIKEPHFFNTDDPSYRFVTELPKYERLFADASPENHIAVGEASVFYLSSYDALKNILDYEPAAKILVCVRNPIDMAQSLHQETLTALSEDEMDFEKAWRLQEQRKNGRRISEWCSSGRNLVYGEICSLGAQLDRVYSRLSRERVLPIVLDDLKTSARAEYIRILNYLNLPDDGKTAFRQFNPAKTYRWRFLAEVMKRNKRFRHSLRTDPKPGGILVLAFCRGLIRLNTKPIRKESLSPEFRNELKQYFKPEIEKLASLLNRDLSHWLK